jgi:hypothetical protein
LHRLPTLEKGGTIASPPGNEMPIRPSPHDLNGSEPHCFCIKLANLNIPKIDLVEIFIDLLEAENLKAR